MRPGSSFGFLFFFFFFFFSVLFIHYSHATYLDHGEKGAFGLLHDDLEVVIGCEPS